MNDSNFELIIASSWGFLESFYRHSPALDVLDFICLADHTQARVLINEETEQDTLYLSIELPRNLKDKLTYAHAIDVQSLSVIGEELSHFFHLVSAAQRDRPVSLLQLEALAEIDRFLMLLHWNSFHPHLSLTQNFQNCAEVCDTVFEQRTFITASDTLYRDAERLALHHLQRAFSHRWTHSYFDARSFDPGAQAYISALFSGGRPVLLSA